MEYSLKIFISIHSFPSHERLVTIFQQIIHHDIYSCICLENKYYKDQANNQPNFSHAT
jgi:hypothetical protein